MAGGSAGDGGMLPGRGVPLFTLNHVSPLQLGPWMTLFCCFLSRSWYASSMTSVLLFGRCMTVLLYFSNLSVGTGQLLSGMKSALRCVLWPESPGC